MLKLFIACAILANLLLTGCANLMTTYEPEDLALPENYVASGGTQDIDSVKWWEAFNSQELNQLQSKALASLYSEDKRLGNYDLQIAYTRLIQSEASLGQSKSSRFPSLSHRENASYSRSDTLNSTPSTSTESKNFGLNLSLSYELDLWGKVAASIDAQEYRYQASYEDLLTSVLSISSNITNNYIDLLSTKAEIALLYEQVELNTSMLATQEIRYKYGQASSLDVIQQQEQLSMTKAQEPNLREEERQLLASLALLCGELPNYHLNIQATELLTLPPLPETGVPLDLLENRPDIRAAKYRLLAADKELSIAKLAYLPDITLSAGLATSATSLSALFENWVSSLSSAISGILFDAGKSFANKKRQDAVTQEALINYIKTVSHAIDEVNTALMLELAQKEYIKNLEEQFTYQQLALSESENRYIYGQETFLRYIIQLQAVQNMQRTLLREEAQLLKRRVTLYKSLGINI